MLSDFTPIIHRLPGRTIRIWPIADVHIGARECDLDGFKSFLRRVQACEDDYLVLVGDLLNNATRSSVSDVYEETIPPSAQIEKAVEILYPTKDRILGCVGGNHELRTKKDVDLSPLYAVMLMLGKGELYRDNMCFIRVVLGDKVRDNYTMLLVHGKSANKKRHFAYSVEGVDAVISGHTHDGIVEKPAALVFTNKNNVTVRPIVSVTATSWLTYGGYAARALCLAKATSNPQCLELPWTGSNSTRGQMRVIW